MSDEEMIEGEDVEMEIDAPELDVDDLEDDSISLEVDFAEDDELVAEVDEEGGADFVEETDLAKTDAAAKKGSDDEDDEEDLRTEDDVEADLDAILREKLTAAEEVPLEDDEEGVVVDDKTDGLERLQPRRPDEIQCAQCFLLVRKGAPGCPVEDDACPLFVS